jgi:hypothetical protein
MGYYRIQILYRKDDKWFLTVKVKDVGEKIISSKPQGDFIIWPKGFNSFCRIAEFQNQVKVSMG